MKKVGLHVEEGGVSPISDGSSSGEFSPVGRKRGRISSAISRHPVAFGIVALVGAGLTIFVLIYFQPQKLFIENKVNEALPGSTGSPAPTGTVPANASPAGPDGPKTVTSGQFRGLAHSGSGRAMILELRDGTRALRFESFEVENGPDLFVLLSPASSDTKEGALNRGAFNLGRLKGNVGNQNYVIPATLDLAKYNSVVIWCERFAVGFAVAPLD